MTPGDISYIESVPVHGVGQARYITSGLHDWAQELAKDKGVELEAILNWPCG